MRTPQLLSDLLAFRRAELADEVSKCGMIGGFYLCMSGPHIGKRRRQPRGIVWICSDCSLQRFVVAAHLTQLMADVSTVPEKCRAQRLAPFLGHFHHRPAWKAAGRVAAPEVHARAAEQETHERQIQRQRQDKQCE